MAFLVRGGLQRLPGVRGVASFQRHGLNAVRATSDKSTEALQNKNKTAPAISVENTQFNVRVVTKHIEVQSTSDRAPLADDRPLVLLFAWLYASRKVLNKHRILYHQRGYDVLTVKGDPIYAFSPTKYAKNIALDLVKFLKAEAKPTQPFLVHSVSVGLVPYSMMIKHAQENAQYADILDRVFGQVLDGLIGDTKGCAIGVGKSIKNPVGKFLYTAGLLSCFHLPGVQKAHDITRTCWETELPRTPILLFGCRNDPMSTLEYNEAFVEGWRKRGYDVRLQFWDDSLHSNHLRLHEDEYVRALHDYLDTLEV